MNALLIAAVLSAWPQLPPDPATAWPQLPEIVVVWPSFPDEHDSSSVEEEFLKPPPIVAPAKSEAWKVGDDGKLIRLPGPKIKWPHQGCLMCLGIHLERTHRVPNDYLETFGFAQWSVIHDNLHNEKAAPEVKPPSPKTQDKSGGCSGGACSSRLRVHHRGLFR